MSTIDVKEINLKKNLREVGYNNLEGLLLTCIMANLVTVDREKKSWEITPKFVKIIDREIGKLGWELQSSASAARARTTSRTEQAQDGAILE